MTQTRKYAHPKVGDVYNELTVLGRCDEINRSGHRLFLCRCSCRAVKKIAGCNVVSGTTKSCGCRRGHYPGNGEARRKPVKGPDGVVHPSVRQAAEASGVTTKCVCERLKRPGSGWTYHAEP